MRPRFHLFVCQNRRPEGSRPSCGARGAAVLRALSAEALRAAGPGAVAVTGSQCLGLCFDGPVVVAYPAGEWFGGVTPEQAAALCAAVVDGPDGIDAPGLRRLALGEEEDDDD